MSALLGSNPGRHNRYSSEDNIPDLQGKAALITGGTTGIGLEVAKDLASKGARVLLLCRREDNPDHTFERIHQHCLQADGQSDDADLEFVECDLANLEEVKRIGDDLCERESRLDIVVCDAGMGVQTFDVSEDGIDRHFAVGHLGHFLLLNRLLPLLQRTASTPPPNPSPPSRPSPWNAPRIICVSSVVHAAAPSSASFISHAELTSESYAAGSPLALYARAKLAAVLFVKFGLAPRLNAPPPASPSPMSDSESKADDRPPQPQGILAVATDPGPVHPGQPAQLAEAYGPVLGRAAKLAALPFERAPADAARSTLWAATAPELEDDWERWQGAYVVAPGEEGRESAMAQDADRGARLWAMSEDLVRKRLGRDALRPWTWSEDDAEHTSRSGPE